MSGKDRKNMDITQFFNVKENNVSNNNITNIVI